MGPVQTRGVFNERGTVTLHGPGLESERPCPEDSVRPTFRRGSSGRGVGPRSERSPRDESRVTWETGWSTAYLVGSSSRTRGTFRLHSSLGPSLVPSLPSLPLNVTFVLLINTKLLR